MTFSDLNLNKPLLNALNDLGYVDPTTIQTKAYSVIMSGRDVVGIAQTGTGKTLAYLLPCLRQWTFSKERFPQILIIVPTRELVVQVVKEVEKLTPYMQVAVAGVYGGASIKAQKEIVHSGLDVLVATPGRLLDLALNGVLKLKSVKRLVIDEIDEMLDLGFRTQLTSILDLLPKKRQNLMFSATMTEDVEILIKQFFNDPEKIEAAPTGTPLEQITQMGYKIPNFYTKINLLESILMKKEEFKKVLVFTATKKLADQLYKEIDQTFPNEVSIIHANKTQSNRFSTVRLFQNGTFRILIATDIVARGLDISEVTHVINFDIPEVAEDYMHRIGRTGRASEKGVAITFITPADAENKVQIEALMNSKIPMKRLPKDLTISDVLTEDEKPKIRMKNPPVKTPKKDERGASFHEKKEKNKKENVKITRAKRMKIKYKKPKTRGPKPSRRAARM